MSVSAGSGVVAQATLGEQRHPDLTRRGSGGKGKPLYFQVRAAVNRGLGGSRVQTWPLQPGLRGALHTLATEPGSCSNHAEQGLWGPSQCSGPAAHATVHQLHSNKVEENKAFLNAGRAQGTQAQAPVVEKPMAFFSLQERPRRTERTPFAVCLLWGSFLVSPDVASPASASQLPQDGLLGHLQSAGMVIRPAYHQSLHPW